MKKFYFLLLFFVLLINAGGVEIENNDNSLLPLEYKDYTIKQLEDTTFSELLYSNSELFYGEAIFKLKNIWNEEIKLGLSFIEDKNNIKSYEYFKEVENTYYKSEPIYSKEFLVNDTTPEDKPIQFFSKKLIGFKNITYNKTEWERIDIISANYEGKIKIKANFNKINFNRSTNIDWIPTITYEKDIVGKINKFEISKPEWAWWSAGWINKNNITIDSSVVDEELIDFPLLVRLNSTRLNMTLLQNDCDDLRFLNSAEDTELSYEIERCNTSSEVLAWVKIPTISNTTNTTFYIYYNNDEATNGENITDVWSNNYMRVYHFGTNASDIFIDSTETANCTISTGSTDIYDYQIGNGISTADDSYLTCGAFSNPNDFTYSFWGETSDSTGISVAGWNGVNTDGMWFMYTGNYATIKQDSSDNAHFRAENIGYVNNQKNKWTIATSKDNYLKVYKDTTLISTDSSSAGTMEQDVYTLYVGGIGQWGADWYGEIDEVRIRNTISSVGWTKTSYYSETDTLLTYGEEIEGESNIAPVINITFPTNNSYLNLSFGINTTTMIYNITDTNIDTCLYTNYTGTNTTLNCTGTELNFTFPYINDTYINTTFYTNDTAGLSDTLTRYWYLNFADGYIGNIDFNSSIYKASTYYTLNSSAKCLYDWCENVSYKFYDCNASANLIFDTDANGTIGDMDLNETNYSSTYVHWDTDGTFYLGINYTIQNGSVYSFCKEVVVSESSSLSEDESNCLLYGTFVNGSLCTLGTIMAGIGGGGASGGSDLSIIYVILFIGVITFISFKTLNGGIDL